jgi:predicted methyltransferase
MPTINLETVVVVNESATFDRPGDVNVFLTPEKACQSLEAIDILNKEYHALTGSGRLLIPTVNVDTVVMWRSADQTDYTDVLRKWLEKRCDVRHLPIEELIVRIGFTQ